MAKAASGESPEQSEGNALEGVYAELVGYCRSIMEGQKAVIPALAECIRKVGKTGAADVVLKKKRLDRKGKLDLVLTGLCGPLGDELACRFAEHVLPIWTKRFPNDDTPRRALEARKAWLRGNLSENGMKDLLEEFHWFHQETLEALSNQPEFFSECCAARAAISAYGLRFTRPDSRSLPWCDLRMFGAGSAAMSALDAVGQTQRKAEEQWQYEQVLEVLFG